MIDTVTKLEKLVAEAEPKRWKAMRDKEGRMRIAVYDDDKSDWRYIAEFHIDGLVRDIDGKNAALAVQAPALAEAAIAARKALEARVGVVHHATAACDPCALGHACRVMGKLRYEEATLRDKALAELENVGA